MIPLVSPSRDPEPEFEVICNGTTIKDAAVRQQRPPERLAEPKQGSIAERLRSLLQANPRKVWTMQQASTVLQCNYTSVNAEVRRLREKGLVGSEIVPRSMSGQASGWGRELRFWWKANG